MPFFQCHLLGSQGSPSMNPNSKIQSKGAGLEVARNSFATLRGVPCLSCIRTLTGWKPSTDKVTSWRFATWIMLLWEILWNSTALTMFRVIWVMWYTQSRGVSCLGDFLEIRSPSWAWLENCRNRRLGLTTKARGLQGCGPRGRPGSHFTCSRECKECEGMNPHTPKGTPMLGVGVPKGLPNLQSVITGVKIHCLEDFFISLKSYWSLDV
jgi:hypothetical protein